MFIWLFTAPFVNANAAPNDSLDVDSSVQPKCPAAVKLLKDTPIAKLHGSMNHSQTALYMSANYCFVYYKPDPGKEKRYSDTRFHEADQQFMLTRAQGLKIAKSYRKAYSWLSGKEQKLIFIHLFLDQLTHTALVTPKASDEKRTEILIAVDISREFHRFILLNFAKDIGNLEALHKLNQLQPAPPKAKDYPGLSKLVDAVLDGSKVISDDRLYELSASL